VWLVRINDSSFSGSTTDFDVDFVSIRHDIDDSEVEDRFAPIIGSEARVGLVINSSTLDTFVSDLVTAPEGRFQLVIARSQGLGFNDTWSGYVLPDLVTIDDVPVEGGGYLFEIRATDGIGRLKTIQYNNAGSAYTGKENFKDHLLNCLNKLSTVADLYGSTDTVLSVICNWHSTVYTYSSSLDPLTRTRTDHKVFLEIDRYGNNNYFSCYDVIKKICTQWGARFLFSGDRYWFIQLNELRDPSSLTIFNYRKDGTANTASTSQDLRVDNIPDNNSSEILRLSGGKWRFYPPLNRVRVLNRMYDVENLAAGESWDQGTSTTFTITNVDHNDGDAALSLFFNLRYITDWNTGASTFQEHWFVWRVTVKIGTYYLKRDVTISGGAVQYGDIEWTTTASYYYMVGQYKVTVDGSDFTGFYYNHTIQVVTPTLPVSGDLDVQVEYDSAQNDSGLDIDGTAGYLTSKTWSANETFVELLTEGTPDGQSSLYDYSYTNTASTANSAEVTKYTDFSGGRLRTRPGWVQVLDDSGTWIDSAAVTWTVGNDAANLSINNLLAREVIRGQITPVRYMVQMQFQNLDADNNPLQPHKTIFYDSDNWVFQRGEIDIGKEIWKGTWWKAQSSSSYNREPTIIRPPGSGGSGGAVGGGANPVGSPGSGTGGSNTGTSPDAGGSTGTGTNTGSGTGGGGSLVRKKETVTSTGAAALPAVSSGSLPIDETLIDVYIYPDGLRIDEDDFTVNAGTGVITLAWAPDSGTKFKIVWFETS